MSRRLLVAAVGILAVLGASVANALAGTPATRPLACTQGVYVVAGEPLLPGTPVPPPDLVTVASGTAAILSGCAPVPARIRATPLGTIVRARWKRCGNRARGVRLRALIAPDCQKMIGRVWALAPPFERQFAAERCNDPTSCRRRRRCATNADCAGRAYCAKEPGHCADQGLCHPRPGACPDVYQPVCGCDGQTYGNSCEAAAAGVNVVHAGECRQVCGTIAGIACPPGQFCEFPPGMCNAADLEGMCVDISSACPRVYDPVCGCDGQTYNNDCARRAAQVQKAHDGPCAECRTDCDCYVRPFRNPCPLMCPMCGNFWTCESGQCVEQCGVIPPDVCPDLCVSNEQCGEGAFCARGVGNCDGLGVCRKRPEACAEKLAPVCGCDRRTYPSACHAAIAGVSVAHPGECRKPCGGFAGLPCPEDEFCELPPGTCASADLEGMCVEVPLFCRFLYAPVCGCDGRTYGNDCARRAAQVNLAHPGECVAGRR